MYCVLVYIIVPLDVNVTGKESVCVANTYVVTVDFDFTATACVR